MIRYSFFLSLCIIAVLAAFTISYDTLQKSEFEKNMVTTQKAMEAMNWPLAERLLQSMLNETKGETKRWDIWLQVLEVRHNQVPHGALTIEYLETMLAEFEDSPAYASIILERLGVTYITMRQYKNAYATLERHQTLPDLTDEQRAIIYQKMAQVNISLELYEMATENLQMCLNLLTLSNKLKANSKYELANISYIQGEYETARVLAQKVFEMQDISDTLRGRAGFMVADCLSAQNKIPEAIAIFTAIQKLYPNELAVTKQIEYLKSGKSRESTLKSLLLSPGQ